MKGGIFCWIGMGNLIYYLRENDSRKSRTIKPVLISPVHPAKSRSYRGAKIESAQNQDEFTRKNSIYLGI